MTRPLLVRAGDETAPWIKTANYNREWARNLHTKMMALNADIDGRISSGEFSTSDNHYPAWKTFINQYGTWMHDVQTPSFWDFLPDWWTAETSWGMGSVTSTLERYTSDLQMWFDWYEKAFGPATIPRPALPTPASLDLGLSSSPAFWAIAALGGGFIVLKLLKR